jgi:hypothetical protein
MTLSELIAVETSSNEHDDQVADVQNLHISEAVYILRPPSPHHPVSQHHHSTRHLPRHKLTGCLTSG